MGKLFNSRSMEKMEDKNLNKKEGIIYNIREARLSGKKDSDIKPEKMNEVKESAKRHFEEIFNRR